MKDKSLVSAVIPAKNSERTISKTIHSLLNQSYGKAEIIVIDDGSTDGTGKIVKNIQKKNKSRIKIKYLRNKKNMGPAFSRNRGINASKGRIIFFTDSDCFVPKRWIESIVKEYRGGDIGGVGGWLEPGEKTFVAWLERMQNKYLLKIKDVKVIDREKCPVGYTNSMTYLKAALVKAGGFDENFKFPSGEDIDLKKRVCKKGYKLVFVPEPIIHLDRYNLDYLLNRMIIRGLNKKAPETRNAKIFYTILMMPLILYKIVFKIIKYKKENVI